MSKAETGIYTEQELPRNPEDLQQWWMPFTANRQFKSSPRLLVAAEGMYYTSVDGRKILDGTAGLWCVNAGHGRDRIVDAITRQAREMDYGPSFQMGHPLPFQLAARLAEISPGDLNHVFFTNSGSESVDTALKIALAYHQRRGEGHRFRLIGRARGYHGVGFGGLSVGGIGANRSGFGPLLPGVDHLPHTHHPEHNAFTRGQPAWGAHLADALEEIVAVHGARTIAAVIVEPMAGSAGVYLPPKGYLQRLRELCDQYEILLIFDEVITGFGRLGAAFAAKAFGVQPDIMTTAKGLTNGTVPMGAVFVSDAIYSAFMDDSLPEQAIELFHGYTYSGHPLASAAGLASLDIYQGEGLLDRASGPIGTAFEDALHALRDIPHIIDIRNMGLVGAIELEPDPKAPGRRGFDTMVRCFERGLLVRVTGDTVALSPPLIVEQADLDKLFEILAGVLKRID